MLRHLMYRGPGLCSVPSVVAGTAASVLFCAAMQTEYWHPSDDSTSAKRETVRVSYLAPPIPHGRSLDTAGVRLAFSNADGPGLKPVKNQGVGRGMAGDERRGVGIGRQGKMEVPSPMPDIDAEAEGHVYVDAEVDREVQRDPTSAAPEYPPFLQENRIEGSLTVEFVVDTTGGADSVTLRVIHSTHPAFEQSLRAALPHMRFVPAELAGRLVRQWVRQEFRFMMPDTTPATTL
jgi:TonB family protein